MKMCVEEGVAVRSHRKQSFTIIGVVHWEKHDPGVRGNSAQESNESPATCILKGRTHHFSGSHLPPVRNEQLTLVILSALRLHDLILFRCCEN